MSGPSPRQSAPTLLVAAGLTLCWGGPSPSAASSRPGARGCLIRDGSDADGSSSTLRQFAAGLERRWKMRVLLDPTLSSTAHPDTPEDDLPIERALNAALAPLRRVTWRRVYLTAARREFLPPAEILAAAARALEQREPDSLLLVEPKAQRLTAVLKGQPSEPSLERLLQPGKLDSRPLYLIYSTTAPRDGLQVESRFADLQQQQLAVPLRPEHRALAMVQMMQLLQAMPAADREAFAGRTLEAGMHLWDSTPPSQRQEMIQQSLQLIQEFGAAPKQDGGGGTTDSRRPSGPTPRADQGDRRALAQTLTARYHTTVLIDPALLLPTTLELPEADLPLDQALAAVASAVPGAAGGRLFLTEAQLKRRPSVEKLVVTARGLDRLAPFTLLLENPATHHSILYLKEQPVMLLLALLAQGRLGNQSFYLIYSAIPSARGRTLEERVANLQQQQIGLMLRMSPDQMAHSLAPVIRSFTSADAETRARLMSLPAMAGLMAGWMPREAKERGQPLAP